MADILDKTERVAAVATDKYYAVNTGGTIDYWISRAANLQLVAGEVYDGDDAASAALLNEVATATNPTLIPNKADLTSGVGGVSGEVSLISGGVEALNVDASQVLEVPVKLVGADAAGPGVLNEAGTATNPTLVPNKADLTSGVGGVSGEVSLVTGGVEAVNIDASQVVGLAAPLLRKVTAGITASVTRTQGNGALTAEINEIDVCATTDDTVTLPTAAAGLKVVVINNGAETLQIFPASGDNLGAGVNLAAQLEANEVITYVAYDATNWHVGSATEILHAEFHDEDNTDDFVVTDTGVDFQSYHSNGVAAGDLAGWTFDAGGAGTSFPIASIADSVGASGSRILVTTTGSHLLAVGDIVSQSNLTDAAYVGIFVVVLADSATTYEVAAVYTATGTGTMDQAATLKCGVGSSGVYGVSWHGSIGPVGNNETFDFVLYKEAATITGTKVRHKFGTADDFGSLSGGGIVTVADGDQISLALSNEDSASDVAVRNLVVVLDRK